ncbi:MAG: hypothetical protein MZV70_54040 [Desulfobacterales bacterium]|nr:hypothetical protein [Desulfobacterales bacterium]
MDGDAEAGQGHRDDLGRARLDAGAGAWSGAQGVEVKAITFYTGFCITETQRRKGGRQDGTVPPQRGAARPPPTWRSEIEYVDISGGHADAQVLKKVVGVFVFNLGNT